jgi:tetratricopeptide (TPR) repeat protein
MRLVRTVLLLPWLLSMSLAVVPTARAAEHPSLAQARALHNAADYDAAIEAAAVARADPAWADAAALIGARAHLERYRVRLDPSDLIAAREALTAVRQAALAPRDQVDLLVGIGQALYLGGTFDAAGDLFEAALDRASELDPADRLRLLEWWAAAIDRQAQELAADSRAPLLKRLDERMEAEMRQDPGNAVANYWLAVVARAGGDAAGAWRAAVTGWVRAILHPESAGALRADLDRLVTEGLIPEREREDSEGAAALQRQWQALKEQWR